ncbi:IS6 family transposase [Microvirga sp. M2]|uniref:IS6 family transposase n=1 Tax=Microvirga sp. M2 TaxID=3073270 RepID=UPI0039C1236A
MFKRRRFPVEIILLCVRWYCKYGISYRDLAEMMSERGVAVDPSTIFRWVQRYAPEIKRRIRLYQGPRSGSWRVDETYARVGGHWKYLFRAVDKHGRLIAFMLSDRRNTNAAYRFLRKAIKAMSTYPPSSITTDKLASYPKAILRLQNKGMLPNDVVHRTSKYLTDVFDKPFSTSVGAFSFRSVGLNQALSAWYPAETGFERAIASREARRSTWATKVHMIRAPYRRVDRQGWGCYSGRARVTPERRAGREVATLPRSLGPSHLIGGTRAPFR